MTKGDGVPRVSPERVSKIMYANNSTSVIPRIDSDALMPEGNGVYPNTFRYGIYVRRK